MAKKKFLMEQNVQVWPITRADCVYHITGNELLSTVVDKIATDLIAEANRAKAAEEALANRVAAIENSLSTGYATVAYVDDYTGGKKLRYVTQAEYELLTDDQKNDENIVWNITDPDAMELIQIDEAELNNMLDDVF